MITRWLKSGSESDLKFRMLALSVGSVILNFGFWIAVTVFCATYFDWEGRCVLLVLFAIVSSVGLGIIWVGTFEECEAGWSAEIRAREKAEADKAKAQTPYSPGQWGKEDKPT